MFSLIGLCVRLAIAGRFFWLLAKLSQVRAEQARKYVDAVHSPIAPVVAGLGAALIFSPLTLIPFVGFHLGTAVVFGAGVAVGVLNGARNVALDRRLILHQQTQ